MNFYFQFIHVCNQIFLLNMSSKLSDDNWDENDEEVEENE